MARYPESHPHRIVLDLALPDHDGMELLKFLADRKCAADIILVSSHGKSMLDQAMKLGDLHRLNMHRMPRKPFPLDDLKAALACLLPMALAPMAPALATDAVPIDPARVVVPRVPCCHPCGRGSAMASRYRPSEGGRRDRGPVSIVRHGGDGAEARIL